MLPEQSEERRSIIADHMREVITLLGEDVARDGLVKTPDRVAKAMQYLTKGYHQDPEEILRSALFRENYRQMVIVKDIDLFSMCEHHLLPFFGKAHVAYIPNGYITGLSKIARVVDVFARRLQVQERLTTQIKECIQKTLNPMGVMVVIEAQHMCMQMRGLKSRTPLPPLPTLLGSSRCRRPARVYLPDQVIFLIPFSHSFPVVLVQKDFAYPDRLGRHFHILILLDILERLLEAEDYRRSQLCLVVRSRCPHVGQLFRFGDFTTRSPSLLCSPTTCPS